MIRVCSRLDSSPNLYTRLNTKPGLPGLQLFAHTSIRLGPGTCPGPEFLSIQILPGPSFFEYLVYAPEQEPARALNFWVYRFRPESLDFRAFCIRYRPGICLGSENLSIQISPGSQFFRVSCIRPRTGTCLGPENLSILISPGAQFFRVSCIRPGPRTCPDPENLSIRISPRAWLFELSVYAPEQESAWPRKIWVYRSCPGPDFSSFLYTLQIGSLTCPEKFEYTVYANDQDPDLDPEFLSIQVLPWAQFFRVSCIRH